jgi:hypothetical protein
MDDTFGGCVLTFWSWIAFAFHFFCGVLTLIWFFGMMSILTQAKSDGVLQTDRLGVSSVLTTMSLFFFSLSRAFRCGRVLAFTHSEFKTMDLLFGITTSLFGAFICGAMVLFGLVMNDIMRRTVVRKTEPFSCQDWIVVSASIFAYFGATIPLAINSQQGLAQPMAASVLLVCWLVIHNRLTCLRLLWKAPGMYDTTKKRFDAIVKVLEAASSQLIREIVALNLSSLLYACCWYYGRVERHRMLMTRWNSFFGCMVTGGAVRILLVIIQTCSRLYQEQVQDLKMLQNYDTTLEQDE